VSNLWNTWNIVTFRVTIGLAPNTLKVTDGTLGTLPPENALNILRKHVYLA
jgi:hypothetical protein